MDSKTSSPIKMSSFSPAKPIELPIPGLPVGAEFFARIPTYTVLEVQSGAGKTLVAL